jgi:choline-glycine betaine transporter
MYYRYNDKIIENFDQTEDGSDAQNVSNLHWTLIILGIILLIALIMLILHFTKGKKEGINLNVRRVTRNTQRY